MKRILSLLLVVCLLLGAAPFAAAAEVQTEKEAYEAMIAYKDIYPEGTPWSYDRVYNWKGGVFIGGTGCAAFAFELSDAAFGDLPARRVDNVDFSEVRVGDILRMDNDSHSVIVLEVCDDYLVLAEGSYNDSVHWGRMLTVEEVEGSDYLLTRYPEGTGDDDEPVESIIPEDAVVIGTGDCGYEGLPNVKWTLTSINIEAFAYSGLKNVTLPEGLTYLGANAFDHCTNLKKLYIPGTVNNDLQYLCQGCTALEKVTFGEGVRSIGRYSFYACPALKSVSFPSSVTYIGEYAFSESGIEELTLPEGLEQIGNYAFNSCANLKTVSIPGSVTTFGNSVFARCTALCEVAIADGITDLGSSTFERWRGSGQRHAARQSEEDQPIHVRLLRSDLDGDSRRRHGDRNLRL